MAEIGYGDLGIRSWSQGFEKLQPVHLSILGDAPAALPALLERCRRSARPEDERRFADRAARHAALSSALRATWAAQARAAAGQEPVAPAHLASEVWEAVRGTDWVLTANLLRGWARRLWTFDRPDRHAGDSLGTATDIGVSLGGALAYRGTGRLVVDLQPDGDLMYDASALWVAAHHHIPMLVVMFNNRAHYNDWDHQIIVARERGRDEKMAYLGMEIDRPPVDFAAVARGFGWFAEGPVVRPGDVRAAVARARDVVLREGRPALVDVVAQYR